MTTTVDVNNTVELHAAGLRALNRELGADGAKMFIELYFKGHGDYTAEKKHRPPMTDAEYSALMDEVKAEAVEAGTWE
jgi:hypothetical protein